MNDPATTVLRRRIIREKGFLRRIYEEWYGEIRDSLPRKHGTVLELGSGAGFLEEAIPDLLKSDVLHVADLSLVMDALEMPLRNESLRAIVMIDVLHHLPQPRLFFQDAARCVKPGGAVIMIEPWVTAWSKLVYSHMHYEPFDAETEEWGFPSTGPLSGANGALPWILFHRDRSLFAEEFPQWCIRDIRLQMPFSYLLSGGVSMRALFPEGAFGPVRWVEKRLNPWLSELAMFALIVLERTKNQNIQ
jgi:SAM-dependent methyltransferase